MRAQDAGDDDTEGLDIAACAEMISRLQADRVRRLEDTERLQEKLKAFNSELAARKEELVHNKHQLQIEQERNKKELQGRQRNQGEATSGNRLALLTDSALRQSVEEQVRGSVEKQLQEKLQKRSQKNELGIRMFDEMELMVKKSREEEMREHMYVDTVLITYKKSSLSYRVYRDKTVAELREDACTYWGCSVAEYVLKTRDNSKLAREMKIQDCFRPHEDMHIKLEKKTPKRTKLEPEEKQAIKAKTGARSRASKVPDLVEESKLPVTPDHNKFFTDLATVNGLYKFMTRGDQRAAVGHIQRMKLSSLLCYGALLILTFMSCLVQSPMSTKYITRSGVLRGMTQQRFDNETQWNVPAFDDIRERQGAWDWLAYTVSSQLMSLPSHVRSHNYLPGWLEVRMQQVRTASGEACPHSAHLTDACTHNRYTDETRATEDLEAVRLYWEGGTDDTVNSSDGDGNETNVTGAATADTRRAGRAGRSDTAKPWQYSPGHTKAEISGLYQVFDGSGYSLQYNLQHEPLHELFRAYREDIEFMRSAAWATPRTRAVQVVFTVYSHNYDYWVSNHYLLEFPADGLVQPSYEVNIYRPTMTDYGLDKEQATLDLCRFVVVVFIGYFHVLKGFMYERKTEDSSVWDFLKTGKAWCDVFICALFLAIMFIRYVIFGLMAADAVKQRRELAAGTYNVYSNGQLYRLHCFLEAIVFTLAMYRCFAFMRLNRKVYLIWSTLTTAFMRGSRFAMVFVPVMLGFVVVGHAIWRTIFPQYRTFWSSLVTIIMTLFGDTKTVELSMSTRPAAVVFSTCSYLIVKLIFINSWIANLVQVYQQVRVTSGYRPSSYAWTEAQYAKFCLRPPLERMYRRVRKLGKVENVYQEKLDE